MFSDFLSKRKAERQLSKLLKAVDVGELSSAPKIKSGRIDFIFTLLRADTPEQLSDAMSVVTNAAKIYGAIVFDVAGPLIIMAIGTHGPVEGSSVLRAKLVADVHQRLGTNVKTVHGVADGHFGLFGNKTRINYTFTFDCFETALATLIQIQFGKVQEIMTKQ